MADDDIYKVPDLGDDSDGVDNGIPRNPEEVPVDGKAVYEELDKEED